MAYGGGMGYHLHMPSYFWRTFTEYPYLMLLVFVVKGKHTTIKLKNIIHALYVFLHLQGKKLQMNLVKLILLIPKNLKKNAV